MEENVDGEFSAPMSRFEGTTNSVKVHFRRSCLKK